MELANGVIFLQHNRKWSKWYQNLVTWLITKMPVKGPFIHTQEYLRGFVYEYTINGDGKARKRLRSSGAGTDNIAAGDLVRKPKVPLTEEQVDKKIAWWEKQIKNGYKYGTPKLLIQLVLGLFLRPFAVLIYRWFGWELMKSNKFWGEHCSGAVDESNKEAGWDTFPGHSEQYSTPSAFAYTDEYVTITI
jgi:hypothetical protein